MNRARALCGSMDFVPCQNRALARRRKYGVCVAIAVAAQPEDHLVAEEAIGADAGGDDGRADHHVVLAQGLQADGRVRRRVERVARAGVGVRNAALVAVLGRRFEQGELEREGEGRKGCPYRYRLPQMEEEGQIDGENDQEAA